MLATLSFALVMVFSGAAATRVVDDLQHHLSPSHAAEQVSGIHGALSQVIADHDHHHDTAGAHPDDDQHHDGELANHHHADGPSALAAAVAPATLVSFRRQRPAAVAYAHLTSGPPKGAPERPPKASQTRI